MQNEFGVFEKYIQNVLWLIHIPKRLFLEENINLNKAYIIPKPLYKQTSKVIIEKWNYIWTTWIVIEGEDFSYSLMFIYYISLSSPHRNIDIVIWTNLNFLSKRWPNGSKGNDYRRRQCISLICYYSPFVKGHD